MDLSSLTSLHRISAAHNRILSVSGMPDSVKFLDLSGNISIDANSICFMVKMFICILRNTQILNVAQLGKCSSLLYLDMEGSRLAGIDLNFLNYCRTLLYLNISNNLYTKVPSLPTIMLRALDLSYNDLK